MARTPHIAARQLALNFRFAVGGGYAAAYQPGSEGVLWWSDYPDRVRHRPTAGLLDRCRATNTCPKIFDTFGGIEFWFLRESPDLVGTDAKSDIPLPPNVRRYFFPGTTHGGGRGGFSAAAPQPPNGCLLPANPNPESDTMRALTVALIDWVTKGTEPPPSRYPRLDQRSARAGHQGRHRVSGHSRRSVAGRPREPVLRFRLRAGFQLQRRIRPDHETTARDPADPSDAGAEGGSRRQRRRRSPFGIAAGPAGHLSRLELSTGRIRQGQDLHLERRLCPVRENQGGTRGLRRSSAFRSKSATARTRPMWMR